MTHPGQHSNAARVMDIYRKKLEAKGFFVDGDNVYPPAGMDEFAVAEITRQCMEEAEREASQIHVPEPYWHEHNPWKDRAIYVPIDELAACKMGLGQPIQIGSITYRSYTIDMVLGNWADYGLKLDGYILDGPVLTGGVRYGPKGEDYLSPGFSLPKLVQLKRKYGDRRR